jgi:hypothetical protein
MPDLSTTVRGSTGPGQWPTRRGAVERYLPHAVSGPVLVGAALSQHRICPLASGSHVGRSPRRRRPREERSDGGGGVVPRTPVSVGREQHGGHPLDSHSVYPDRFLRAGMGCPFHRNLFERRSADRLKRCPQRRNGLIPRAWAPLPFRSHGPRSARTRCALGIK